jgi:hypothetical protein
MKTAPARGNLNQSSDDERVIRPTTQRVEDQRRDLSLGHRPSRSSVSLIEQRAVDLSRNAGRIEQELGHSRFYVYQRRDDFDREPFMVGGGIHLSVGGFPKHGSISFAPAPGSPIF